MMLAPEHRLRVYKRNTAKTQPWHGHVRVRAKILPQFEGKPKPLRDW